MSASTSNAESRPVRRREVIYLSGFDPQGPAHYHAMYQAEAPQQAQVSGYQIDVGPRRKQSARIHHWSVRTETQGQSVETDYQFYRWDDVVRTHWPRGRWGLWRSTAQVGLTLFGNGLAWSFLKTSWPAALVLMLPSLLGLFNLLVLLAGLALSLAVAGPLIGGLIVLATAAALGFFTATAEKKIHMAWLMRSAACVIRQARQQTPDLHQRLDELASDLARSLNHSTADEILIVGHSSGAMIAASVLARALRQCPAGQPNDRQQPAIGLLTLGHSVLLLSGQPEAAWFRQELAEIASDARVTWVDVTAPPDGCCFALCDPTRACATGERPITRPKLVSARFAQLNTASTYAAIKRDKYRCHFQYLKAGEIPGTYDFFLITSGTATLREYFAHTPSQTDFKGFQLFGGPSGGPSA